MRNKIKILITIAFLGIFISSGFCFKIKDAYAAIPFNNGTVDKSKTESVKTDSVYAQTGRSGVDQSRAKNTDTKAEEEEVAEMSVGLGGSSAVGGFQSPLMFNSIEGFSAHFLTYLQRIIVILSLVFVVVGSIIYIISVGDDGMTKKGKNTITFALVGLAIGIAAPSFLKELSIILGWGKNVNSAAVKEALTLTQIAMKVLNFLLSVVGIISLLMMIIGGITYVTSTGDGDRIDSAKKIVRYSVIGVIVALSSMLILKQIAAMFSV